jgi:iron complex transport system ATP-binding protein
MILNTDKLTVGYGKKKVVTDISIKALEGQFICLLGPNGSGKSTILKSLVKMLAPIEGTVYIEGHELSKYDSKELAKTVAVVLTDRITPGLLTVFDVVSLGRHPYTSFTGKTEEEDIEKVLEALRMVNASDLTERYFGELSDGETQKVMLARALAQEPKLIVLDEPTSHLDARHRIEVMLILRYLSQEKGVTIIASLHDIDLALKACDVAILVKGNRILAHGAPEDILDDDKVAKLYDMDKASFSGSLGGVELHGSKRGSVFVVGGGGSGAQLYRSLVKHSLNVITGILPENDIDYHIAKAVNATIISDRAYHDISLKAYEKALKAMVKVNQVVDTGFPIGSSNLRNIELILQAIDSGKITYTMRTREEAEKLYNNKAKKLIYCRNLSALLGRLWKVDRLSSSAWH